MTGASASGGKATRKKSRSYGKSAYTFFAKENRAKIAAHNEGLSAADINKALGLAWKMASAKHKTKYERMAAKDRARVEGNEKKEKKKKKKKKEKTVVKPKKKKMTDEEKKRDRIGYQYFVTKEQNKILGSEADTGLTSENKKVLRLAWKECKSKKQYVREGVREKVKAKKQKEKEKRMREKALEKRKKEKEKAKAKKAARPKRARSAYTYFVAENRSLIQQQHPTWSFQQLAKALGLAWNNCTDKHHYQELAAQDKLRAERDRARLKAMKPKRAMSAYMFFVKDNRGKLQDADLNFAEIGKALGLAWRNASATARTKYMKMAEEDKARAELEKNRNQS